jgi:Co/Zn/Cd efflux system component
MVTAHKFVGKVADYKRSLKIVFFIHIGMFVVAFSAAILGRSTSVLADSLDFIGDAASYAISLYVLKTGALFRSVVAIAKALTMLTFGIPVLVCAVMRFNEGSLPDAQIMSIAGGSGIVSHIICIYYLYRFRDGDSNQMSVWICTINDLISNVLTIIPDIISAATIVILAIIGAFIILRQAIKEIKIYKSKHEYAEIVN